jgi:hypothetical protein
VEDYVAGPFEKAIDIMVPEVLTTAILREERRFTLSARKEKVSS